MRSKPVRQRRLSRGATWLQAIRIAGVVAGIVVAFQIPDPGPGATLLERGIPFLAIVGITAVTSMVAARVLLGAERRHDRVLEAHWQRTARERAWRFDDEYLPVDEQLRDLLLGGIHRHGVEGSPYRLTGARHRRAMTVQMWLVHGNRMLPWRQLPERRTIVVVHSHVALPLVGFGTGGPGMRMIERGPRSLQGATYGTHSSGHWVAAGEPDVLPVAMEVFEPFLADMIKPLRIVRVVADGDRVGLMINQEKSIEEIFGWLDTMDQIATVLEDAVRTGLLPAGQPAQTAGE